ncbi:MAG: hypothetical protein ABH877_05790, partial [bacterium]
DVGDRLVPGPPRDQFPKTVDLASGKRAIVLRVEMDAVEPERLSKKKLRIEPGGGRSFVSQIAGRRLEQRADGPAIQRGLPFPAA